MTEYRSQDKGSGSSNVESPGGFATKVVATASTLMGPRFKGLPAVFRNQMFQKAINNALGDDQRNGKMFKKHTGEIRVEMLTKQLKQERKLRGKSYRRKDFDVLSDEMLHAVPGNGGSGSDRGGEGENADHSNNGHSNNSNTESVDDNDQESEFSLFQGFTATIPDVDDKIQQVMNGSSRLLEFDAENGSLVTNGPLNLDKALPLNITEEKIQQSASQTELDGFKEDINYRLDLLEIRKGLSANEINEIDCKIDTLYKQRKLVFDRISSFEKGQSYLEDQLSVIESRLQTLKASNPQSVDLNGIDHTHSAIRNSGSANNEVVAGMSKMSLNSASSGSGEKSSEGYFDAEESSPFQVRKHKPTLQKYFKPGEKIGTFQAHDDSITCLAFDEPFGKLVTASHDNTVKVWNLSTESCVGSLEGHLSNVLCLAMDSGVVATGSLDATVKLWDLAKVGLCESREDLQNNKNQEIPKQYNTQNNTCLMKSLDGHIEEVTAVGMSSGILVSGSADKTIRQWDVRTGNCVQTIDVLWAINSRQDESRRVENTLNFSTTNYSLKMPTLTKTWDTLQYPFTAALQCYDAALASGGSDGIVRLWDLRSGDIVRQLLGHTGPITSVQFDDTCLITGSADSTVRIWDLRTGKILESFSYDSPITSLQFDYSKVVCTNGQNTVKIYDRITSEHRECGPGLENSSSSVINFTRYSQGYLVEGRQDGNIGIWAI